jgi:hypothetical protein
MGPEEDGPRSMGLTVGVDLRVESKVYGSGVTDQTRHATQGRWVTLFVALLLAAAAAFVIGVAVERDHAHAETATSQSSSTSAGGEGTHSEAGEAGTHSEAGEGGHESAGNGETSTTGERDRAGVGDEFVLSIDPESSAAVATAVLISLLIAAVVWRWPVLPTLLAGAIFCLAAAAFDVREVAHQTAEGRTGVAAIALLVTVLHLAAAVCAGAGSAQRRQWNEVTAARGSG